METLQLNFPPQYVLAYTKKWAELARQKKETTEHDQRLLDDIVTLLTAVQPCLEAKPRKDAGKPQK